ncbi:hypothetical protein HHI36_014293 [Cryptolaemus montrouzieri]|uniref:Uncharacterized protein n=1 Tax=Cryptolaemus montrouzieri TaxID=559131 RepID=A0ABD2N2B3_9CUCU
MDMQKLKDSEVQTKVKQRINQDALKEDATDDINVEEGWKQVKSIIINIEQVEVGYTDIGYKNPWMTQEILLMMDTRRSYKRINKDKYNEVNREKRGKIVKGQGVMDANKM